MENRPDRGQKTEDREQKPVPLSSVPCSLSSVLWFRDHRLWLELFILANLGCLAPDIYLAHSTNSFKHPAEWLPLIFSLVAPGLMLVAIVGLECFSAVTLWRVLGHIVGWSAVLLGIAGLILHLESHFFQERTMASLVYTAPFVAPLAYAGIGLLAIMNRMIESDKVDWPMWVLFLALGGFIGNFILSLADHAQNGFYHRTEWIPVASSALAVGFLLIPFLMRVNRLFLAICFWIMLLQAAVGILGFCLHNLANLHGPSPRMLDNLIDGAPPLAPMLLPNLALLAILGLWVLSPYPASRAP